MADNIWPGILSMIASKTAITDLLGTSPVRLFPVVLPQGLSQFPSGTYRVVSQLDNRTFREASTYDFNMVDFHIYGNTKAECDTTVSVLRRELEQTTGTFNGIEINGISYVDSGSDYWEDEIKKYSKQIEFKIDTRR